MQRDSREITVNYVRIYAGADGASHFEDMSIETESSQVFPGLPPLGVAAPILTTSLRFIIFPGQFAGWRTAPRRQFVVFGSDVEIEVSDGEIRSFLAGTPLLFEDTEGRGHDTRMLGNAESVALFIALA